MKCTSEPCAEQLHNDACEPFEGLAFGGNAQSLMSEQHHVADSAATFDAQKEKEVNIAHRQVTEQGKIGRGIVKRFDESETSLFVTHVKTR